MIISCFNVPVNIGFSNRWIETPLRLCKATRYILRKSTQQRNAVGQCRAAASTTLDADVALQPVTAESARQVSSFWRLWKLAGPEKKILALAMISVAFATGSALLQPLLFGRVLATLISFASTPGLVARKELHKSILNIVVTYAVEVSATYVYLRCSTTVADRVLSNLRKKAYHTILRQEAAFFDTAGSSSELTAAVTYDIDEVKRGVYGNLQKDRGIRAFIESFGGAVIVSRMSPKIALVFMLIVPIVALGCAQYGKYMGRIAARERRELDNVANAASEAISNIKTVKSYGADERESRKFAGLVGKALSISYMAGDAKSKIESFNRLAIYITLLSILYFGGNLVALGEIPINVFVSSFGYSWLLVFGMQGCSFTYSDVPKVNGALRRVFGKMDEAAHYGRRRHNNDDVLITSVHGNVVFEDVTFSYPSRKNVKVLQNLNLKLLPRKMTAIVGHSGAGKTTLASLLSRFYEPDAGRILLDDVDISRCNRERYSENVALVSQDPVLFRGTIRDNIAYGVPDRFHPVSDEAIQNAARLANAHSFIDCFPEKYDTVVRGDLVSGGQRQRIAIARALLRNAPILILDEATSALDAESEAQVQNALDRLMKGRTTLVIAHRLSTIIKADQIVFLKNGMVSEKGTHGELMKIGKGYRDLMETQSTAFVGT